MKNGLQPGTTAEFSVTVTAEMVPVFDGEVIHPVLSTVSMIYHMEKAGRYVLLPHLEDHEEGSGFAIDIKHVGPAVIGQEVTFRAVCVEVTQKRVVCEVTADTARNRVGVGFFTQAIFNKDEIQRRFQQLQAEIDKKYDRIN
ncbi:thioesterase, FlK family [Brevibacillus choshinensis]|uniref:thioesterase family protein n=1 Tax=Brevibacillus choshinensis TaxID=54911 RepID=UPI002E1D6389|nr:thioesterase [Brevibacillus choshinensis]MED4752267.1 thioesterase [Brevibacillus choshinensis]MED4783894.1 thioesterase [Brevibacillus choshinensis]